MRRFLFLLRAFGLRRAIAITRRDILAANGRALEQTQYGPGFRVHHGEQPRLTAYRRRR